MTADVLHEAADAGLIALVERRPEFRHPLMRSAVYERATVTERIAIHRTLAAALDDIPERRLARLAAATLGPDDDLATRLEQFADDAQARGKVAAAVPALSQAAGLVSDSRRRTRILVRAAQLSSDLNDRYQARMLLGRADLGMAGPVERARLLLVSENAVELGLTATAALVAALRGEASPAAGLIAKLRAATMFPGMRFVTAMAQQVDGLLALFDGQASRAYAILAAVFDPAGPHYHSSIRRLIAPDLADAAVAAGVAAEARDLLIDLPALARQLPSDMMTTAYAYASAVLAPDRVADQLFADSLAALPAGARLARARLSLQHGRRLRQQGRDARALLRTARDEFDLIGARPWAEMARAELRAAGEVSSRPRASMSSQLSAQQVQIATLAARGLSNEEIAERLFISRHTVSAHLSQIRVRSGAA